MQKKDLFMHKTDEADEESCSLWSKLVPDSSLLLARV